MDRLVNIAGNIDLSVFNPVLIGVLLVLVFFTVSGYRRGFIKLALSLLSMFVSFYLVALASPHISDYIRNETDIYDTLTVRINESFEEINSRRDNTLYENQMETIGDYRLPSVVKELLLSNNTKAVYDSLMARFFEEYVSKYMAGIVIKALSFVCAFFMVMLLLKITLLSAEFISHLPVINGINRLAGGIFGFAEGFFIVLVAFTAATFLVGRPFYETVSTSRILTLIYNNNIILRVILMFL